MVDYRSDRLFPIDRGTLPWQPILRSKSTTLADLLSFVALTFKNGLEYRHSDFKRFISDDLATLFVNLVNFGPAIPEFKIGKNVHPVVSFFKINLSDSPQRTVDSYDNDRKNDAEMVQTNYLRIHLHRFLPNFHHVVCI